MYLYAYVVQTIIVNCIAKSYVAYLIYVSDRIFLNNIGT